MNKDINIQEVIDLIKTKIPENLNLNKALENAKNGDWESKAYYKFIDATNANKPGAEWQFKENIIVEHPTLGTIVLDILTEDRLGGIEFVELT
ncbi:hypothetical protein [Chryseobacterium polytrichastri]|uniref:Uncharacterized protein n=1 Tax=Chryseobacterium polytrichastri TaxID=1302687 RepID=A0A1M7CF85_9FLAO|nr:hypothetical protein [Chryseobacterium polytrichastri]SHL65539.1 hypothetical protein SAMN05444267_10226 [Chryseobacterium polytrichastri]